MTAPGDPVRSAAPLRVALVDDDPMVREHLTAILDDAEGIEVIGSAGDVAGGSDVVAAHRPHVLLLDIRMPGGDGIAGLPHLLRLHPDLAVAMLTTFHEEDYVRGAIAGGARGFLLKTDRPDDLVRAVRALAEGGAVFSPRVARWLVRAEATAAHAAAVAARRVVEQLSPRQREVLLELAEGASNAEIARRLHLTEGTVKQYLSGIFVALGVDSRVQAAVLAHRAGLISGGGGR